MITTRFSEAPTKHEADIVIVGAGISGLYCAWRIVQDDIDKHRERRITIVERLNRTGGRLDTDIIDIKPGQVVREEEGGMRFNYGMTELMQLTKALDLCDDIVPFPMGSDVDGRNTNRFFLRGRGFTKAEATEGGNKIWGEIYNLDDDEKGLSPTDIVTNAYKAVLRKNDLKFKAGQPPEFWTDFRENRHWNGIPLNKWQMWGLLRDMGRSEECIQMLSETIGFAGPFKAPINAGDAFQILADFPKVPTYFTFKRGFSTLPDAVIAKLQEHKNVQLMLSTNVDSIRRNGSGGDFELKLTEASEQRDSNPFIPGGVNKTVTGKKLILAIATNGMERLFATSPALNEHPDAHRLWENIHSARGMKLMKINLYFEHPWWQNGTIDPPVQFGPNFSSLPINAVYPFYSLSDQGSLSAAERIPDQAAALTIYCDFDNTNFWSGLQNVGPAFTSRLQQQQSTKRPQTLFAASRSVVDEAKTQLKSLFGIDEVPEPVLTSYRLWDGIDDFEFAYHQWRLNVVDSEVREYLSNPIDGLYFCNEAISDMQGWVNGSLRSSNLALAHFGVKPMDGASCSSSESATDSAEPVCPTGLWGG